LIKKISASMHGFIRFLLVLTLSFGLLFSGTPAVTFAAQNPTPEEIKMIFDQVAKNEQVPAEILEAIAWGESGWRQWDSNGNVVTGGSGSRPYIGIMQVGTYDPADQETISKLKNDIAFNIAYGAKVLISKWEMTPRIGDGDRSKLENWYFAIWAYNSWSTRNNPNNAAAAGRVAYQDKILKLIASDYYCGLTDQVSITPVPKSLLPGGVLPSKNATWETPTPIHYASYAMFTGLGLGLSRSQETALLTSVPRIFGIDRIDTSARIAYQGWPYGCETMIITTSEKFPDALAGVALAKKYNAPILITPQNELDSRIEETFQILKPLKIIILGGESAVSLQVENRIREVLTWTSDIERIAGENRFETAALIASRFPVGSGVAIATGYNYPDALSLASAAATKDYPLLLTAQDSLPQATEDILKKMSPGFLYIAGGEKAVSEAIITRIKEITSLTDEQIIRFEGKDRYETSSLIQSEFFPETDRIYLATGENYPDALTGAALAASQSKPMLLVPPEGPITGSGLEKYLQSLAGATEASIELEVFGGNKAVTDQSIIKIKYILNK